MKEPNDAARAILSNVADVYEKMLTVTRKNNDTFATAIGDLRAGDLASAQAAIGRASDKTEASHLMNLGFAILEGVKFADPDLWSELQERVRIDHEKTHLCRMTVEHLKKELEEHTKHCHDATCVTPRAIAEVVREKSTVAS